MFVLLKVPVGCLLVAMHEKTTEAAERAVHELEVSIQEYEGEYQKPFVSECSVGRPCSVAKKAGSQRDAVMEAAERDLISRFLSASCPCGQDCQQLFSVSEILESRENFRLMLWREQHTFIVGKLQTFMRGSGKSISARRSNLRERQKFDYFINADRPVCRAMFLFYYGESIDRLKRHQKSLAEIGTLPPEHGNTGRTPKHACKGKDRRQVKTFIANFTAVHGLPDPGRDLRAAKGHVKIYLPTVMNYRSVHRIYEKSMITERADPVGYQTFRRLWIEHFPHVVFSKTRSDLCMTCEDNKKMINASISSGDEEYKLDCLRRATEHLIAAKKERDYYRASIQRSKAAYAKKIDGKRESSIMHYSWDFAQQLHYPYEDHQVGPIYFKSPRTAQLFGVCCEAIPRQVNYLIDEADFQGKGADTVISLLDHFFHNFGAGEDHMMLTADNCVGQNKNNALMHYLMYLVMTGKHQSICLSFMLVGHTKFAPDGYFGLIKKRYRRSKIYTYDHLVDVIESSTIGGYNRCQKYRDGQGRAVLQFRKWSSWLGEFFLKLPKITKYQHFRIDRNHPGLIFVKESVEAEEKAVTLLKNAPAFGEKPIPFYEEKTLPAKRQWYLYEMIRPHIPSDADKNATAPKPKVPKPTRERG